MRACLAPFLCLVALFGLAAPPAARAAPADAVAAALPAPADLFVELVVNGEAHGALAAMTQAGDRLLVEAAALRAAGIALPGVAATTDRVDLAQVAGLTGRYDAAGQRLLLDVDPALLPLRRITAPPREHVAPIVDTGVVLNYDLFVQAAGGTTRAALSTEQRVFGRFGIVSNSGVLRLGGPAGAPRGYVRLDTRYRWVDERRAVEVVAGDLITRTLTWTRAVRLGGLELSRDFALRPDLITVPLPAFAGQSAVPTGVDLFVNGYRQGRAEVSPGRFVLDSVPVVNGAGEARIVTTDAVGRQIATVIPFYVAPELLKPGLSDFAASAGFLRRDYGLAGFRYGRAVATASLRRGITRHLTLSAHGEGARGLAGGGLGAVWSPGLWGAVNGAAAISRSGAGTGTQLVIGYTYTGRRVALGAEHVERSADYRDIAGFDLGRLAGSRRSDRISVSLPVEGIGSLGAGYVASRLTDGTRARLASVSLSAPLGRRASLFAAADYDLDRKAMSAQLRLVVPFGARAAASAGLVRAPGGDLRAQASVARTPLPAGGIGYALDAARGGDGRALGQGSLTWRGPAMEVEAGAATAAGTQAVWGSVAGSFALLDGHVFAARALPGAFAVVSTGMPGVPVTYENQPVGRTDRGGRLFVPHVVAWHPGRFSVDAAALPEGAVADRPEARAALRAGTGGIVRLPVAHHRIATARLVDAAGAPLPAGTIARFADGQGTPVGWDGVVVITDRRGAVPLVARTAAGPCTARAQVPDDPAPFTDLGAVRCVH